MQFYRQGTLDGFCGLYSIINALYLMTDGHVDSENVFSNFVDSLGSSLPKILINGATTSAYLKLIKISAIYLKEKNIGELSFKRAFKGDVQSLNEWWNKSSEHIQEHGEGSIIMRMSGEHNHWTCIRHLTDEAIVLADSGDLDKVHRFEATISKPTSRRKHGLDPDETFMLVLAK